MAAPDVFIIESLRFEDESGDRLEGKTLSNILRLAGKNPAYYYIRTKLELSKILHIFDNSDYRYLHFSFHGGSDGLDLTLETLANRELYNIISPHIDKKRIFFPHVSIHLRNLRAMYSKILMLTRWLVPQVR
jgi:hypothetical protein